MRLLYSGSSLSGVQTGSWMKCEDIGQLRPFTFELAAGTATYELQGRIAPGEVAIVIDTDGETTGKLVTVFPEMRLVLTAATGATVRACLATILRD